MHTDTRDIDAAQTYFKRI